MRVVHVATLFMLIQLGLALAIKIDPDDKEEPLDEISEQTYQVMFNVPPKLDAKGKIDKVEQRKRAEALKLNERRVHEHNKAYEAGNITWFEKLNKISDTPSDEYVSVTGGLPVPGDFPSDEESEKYFQEVRLDRSNVPDSYSSVEEGLVTSVKNQKQCGSCAAFGSIAAIEICARKAGVSAALADYSEQQMLDCAYNPQAGIDGCRGAANHAYLDWASNRRFQPTYEANYGYKNKRSGTCPRLQGGSVQVTGKYFNYNHYGGRKNNDEELLKRLVYKHGAAVVSLRTKGTIQNYKGDVYQGCSYPQDKNRIDHVVTVVGYGTTDSGVPYWLIKNSWGNWWGEGGYFRMKRGVNMCNINYAVAVVECKAVPGAPKPKPTPKPKKKNWFCRKMGWFCG